LKQQDNTIYHLDPNLPLALIYTKSPVCLEPALREESACQYAKIPTLLVFESHAIVLSVRAPLTNREVNYGEVRLVIPKAMVSLDIEHTHVLRVVRD
jgi:hypothetical protein